MCQLIIHFHAFQIIIIAVNSTVVWTTSLITTTICRTFSAFSVNVSRQASSSSVFTNPHVHLLYRPGYSHLLASKHLRWELKLTNICLMDETINTFALRSTLTAPLALQQWESTIIGNLFKFAYCKLWTTMAFLYIKFCNFEHNFMKISLVIVAQLSKR